MFGAASARGNDTRALAGSRSRHALGRDLQRNGLSGCRAVRKNPRRLADHHREHQRVERTPGINPPPVDLEGMRRLVQRDAIADHVAIAVVLRAWLLLEQGYDVLLGPADRRCERLRWYRTAFGEFAQQHDEQLRALLRKLRWPEETGGDLRGISHYVHGCLVGSMLRRHERLPQPAQHDSCVTSLVKVCAASFRPSTIVRYGNS
jgi:hypothetical protein